MYTPVKQCLYVDVIPARGHLFLRVDLYATLSVDGSHVKNRCREVRDDI